MKKLESYGCKNTVLSNALLFSPVGSRREVAEQTLTRSKNLWKCSPFSTQPENLLIKAFLISPEGGV